MLHNLADRVRAGETLVGTWLYLGDTGVAEVLAGCGFDFILIDMEHSPTGFEGLRPLLMAVERRCPPIVRVKANAPEFISAVLDLGPAGVMVPRVNTAEAARAAVRHCKYHPLGERGFGPYRVSDYTRRMGEVLEHANRRQVLWVQIEHADALANLPDIAAVPGIDALFVGPGDLSQSLGHLGRTDHPEVTEAMGRAVRLIREAGLPAGSAFGAGGDWKRWRDAGMRVFTVGADFRFVLNGADAALKAAREGLGLG